MRSLVITTINPPNREIFHLAEESKRHGIFFCIVGDRKSPIDFAVKGGNFLPIEEQYYCFPKFSKMLPINHYSRKNIGYLTSIRNGATVIQETDDDNLPLENFWVPIETTIDASLIKSEFNWINVYEVFTKHLIWPRGFPLDMIQSSRGKWTEHESMNCSGLIRQGVANGNPDVDAIFRLLFSLPMDFGNRSPVVLDIGKWCPFNSQNTIFLKKAFPLLYLPSYCSFRMTDIWRSFIAQRCLWENGESVVHQQASVRQTRNEHDLMKDFSDEIPGYTLNKRICEILDSTTLQANDMASNLVRCYESLCSHSILPDHELPLVKQWVADLEQST